MEKQGERASLFYYFYIKVHLYNGKIGAHVVLSFAISTKTLLNKKLLNTVKYATATERSGN